MRSVVPASVFRRIAAGVYDLFLLFATLILATSLALLLNQGDSLKPYSFIFGLYLLTTIGFFYCWFWTHGGQTLGMKAWKIKAVSQQLGPLTWPNALKRFCFAVPSVCLAGIGYLPAFLNKHKLSAHDYVSQTRIIFKTD